MSTNQAILVLGAGELGTAMALGLAPKATPGHRLSVLVRPSSVAQPSASKAATFAQLCAAGVEILGGELESSSMAALAALLAPFDTVVSCTGYSRGSGTQTRIVEAVLAAGVRRFVPWQFGCDYDAIGRGGAQELFDEQLDVRARLRGQAATEWVIVSTGVFMSFLFAPWWGVVDLQGETVRALGGWENRFTATSAEDIGTLTAEVLFAEPKIRNEAVFIGGDTVSYAQLADIVDKVRGKKLNREVWDLDRLEGELAEDPQDDLRKYRVVWARGRGVAWEFESTFNAKRGIGVTSLEQYAMENLK